LYNSKAHFFDKKTKGFCMNKRKIVLTLIALASIALLTQTTFSRYGRGWGWGGGLGWGGGWGWGGWGSGWGWPAWGYPSYWYPSWSYGRDRYAQDDAYRAGLSKGREEQDEEEIKKLKEENKRLKEKTKR